MPNPDTQVRDVPAAGNPFDNWPEPTWLKRAEEKQRALDFVKKAYGISERIEKSDEKGIKSFLDMKRDLDGWTPKHVELFKAVHKDYALNPERNKARVEKEIIDIYSEAYSKQIPLVRDVIMGVYMGRQNLFSLAARPFSGETADEMNYNVNLIGQAAAQSDKDSLFGRLGGDVRGATSSIYQAATLGATGGGAAAVIGGFALGEMNQATSEANKAGLKGKEKWAYIGRAGAIEGLIAGGFQLAGWGGFESIMGGTRQLTRAGLKEVFKRTGVSLLQELPEEGLTEILHGFNNAMSLPGQEPMTLERGLKILKDTTIQTTLAVGASGAYQGIKSQSYLKQKDKMMPGLSQRFGIPESVVNDMYDRAAKKSKTGEDFQIMLGQELTKTPEGVQQWARDNLKQAQGLIDQDSTSRTPFNEAGLPKMKGPERAAFLGELKKHEMAIGHLLKIKDIYKETEHRAQQQAAEFEEKPEPVTETGELTERLEAEVKPEPVVEEAPQEAPQVQDVKGYIEKARAELDETGAVSVAGKDYKIVSVAEGVFKLEITEDGRKIASDMRGGSSSREEAIYRAGKDFERDAALIEAELTPKVEEKVQEPTKEVEVVPELEAKPEIKQETEEKGLVIERLEAEVKPEPVAEPEVVQEPIESEGKKLAQEIEEEVQEPIEQPKKKLKKTEEVKQAEEAKKVRQKAKLQPKQETEAEVEAEAEEEVEEERKISETDRQVFEGIPLAWVKTEDIQASAPGMNIKKDADPVTGIVPGKEIQGDINTIGLAPIVVWDRLDGTLVIATGRHRLDFYRRKGLEYIKVQIVKESEGFTADTVKAIDAKSNILDGQGSVLNYVDYFRESKISKEVAEKAGFFRDARGRDGFVIAKDSSDDLLGAVQNESISTRKAGEIASSAPGNEGVQAVALREAKTMTADQLGIFTKNLIAMEGRETAQTEEYEQLSMFGPNESATKQLKAVVKQIDKEIKELKKIVAVPKQVTKNPIIAKRLGINQEDPDVAAKAVEAAKQRIALLKRPITDPALYAEMLDRHNEAATKKAKPKPKKAKPKPKPKKTEQQKRDNLKPKSKKVVEEPKTGQQKHDKLKPKKKAEGETKKSGFKSDRKSGASKGADVSYYDSTMPDAESNALVENQNKPNPMIFGMPDMLELLRAAKAALPKIMRKLSKKNAIGLFRSINAIIELRHDIFIGPVIETGLVKKENAEVATAEIMAQILDQHKELSAEDIEMRKESDKSGKVRITFYKTDPDYARRVLAHEIGHWMDFMPEGESSRGNLLGRIAKLKGYLKTTIDALQTDPSKVLLSKDRARIRREAERKVGRRPEKDETADLAVWKKEVSDEYKERIDAEVEARGLITRDEVMNELKDLTMWWKPFSESADENYTKYRYSGTELYADALSVLLNNPAALKKRAPIFYNAFFQYAERSAEVKEIYNGIVDEIRIEASGDRSIARLYESYRKGDAAQKKELEKASTETSTVRETLGSLFVDRFYRLIVLSNKAIKKLGATAKLTNIIDFARYSGSQIESYIKRMQNDVGNYLEKHNLTDRDLGVYLTLLRSLHERKQMANPITGDLAGTKQALEAFEKRMGPKKMKQLEVARQRFVKVRNELVLDRLAEAGIYDAEFMGELRSNEYYATYEVVEYIDRKFGEGNGVKIFRQLGTTKGISNPVSATFATDISLIRSLNWNQAKAETADFLNKYFPHKIEEADTKWNGRYHEIVDPSSKDQGLIVFMRDGELQGYYVESGIANAFHSEISEDVKGAVKLLRAISVPARIWYTTIRPGFQAFNTFFRDPMRSHWHTKGLSLWRTYINLFKSLKAAGSELVTGVTEEALEEMRQRGLLISWANTSGLDDHDTQTERIFAKYSDHKAWRKNIANPFKKWFSRYLLLSNIGEIANKRAGFIYLKANQKALGLSDSEIDRMVRHEIGSPSFITGGSMTPVTNNLFLFSNAIIQGWRTDIGALKNNPKLLPKFIAGAVLPKAIMLSLQTGALVALLKALGADDDDPFVQWAKAMEEMYKRISEYDMTNYFCLPCGLQEDGEVVALRLPQDEFTRVVGGLFYKVVSGDTAGIASLAKDAARYMGDQGPGLNPLISCAIDTYTYLTDENPYDSFRRRHALTDTEQEARSTASGRSRAHKVFSKWLWNNYGGSFIYRFPYSNPAESKSKLENFLELPFMGDLAGRFVKVTDYGMVEKAKKAIAKPRGKRSAEKLEIRDAVAKDIQNVDLSKKEKSLMTSEYADYYRDVLTVRGGEQVHRLVEMGKNSAEKKAIIDSLFDRSSKDPAVKAVLDKFAGEQLYVISNAKFITRNKGENSKDFKKRQLKRDREVADAISLLDGIDLTRKEAVSLLRAAAIKHGIKTQKTIAKRIRQVLLNMYPNSKP